MANTLAESGEAGVVMEERRDEEEQSWPSPDPADIVFRSSTSRYFCGEGRSNSPFGTEFYNFKQHTLRTCIRQHNYYYLGLLSYSQTILTFKNIL